MVGDGRANEKARPRHGTEHAQRMNDNTHIWYRVQHCDPSDQQLTDERVLDADTLAQQRDKFVDVELVALGHNIFNQTIWTTRVSDDMPTQLQAPSSWAPFLTSMSTSA